MSTDGTVDCQEPDGLGGCVDGDGQNQPSQYTACYAPVIALLELVCGYDFTVVDGGSVADCYDTVNITRNSP